MNVKTGRVEGKTAQHHTSAEFVEFLTELVVKTKWAREIHIVLDNLSAHKAPAVEQFLADHPKSEVPLHPNLLVLAEPGGDLVLSISETASGLKWATELVVDGALEAMYSQLRLVDRRS
jgi:hypothetical protein